MAPARPDAAASFETSADETIALAASCRLHLAVNHRPDFYGRREVTWTSVAFRSEESH